MNKVQPDFSFERDGVSLSEWLWRLVDDVRATRVAAGETLSAMQMALPSMHTDWENIDFPPDWSARCDAHQSGFAQAIREAVAAPGFDTAEFVGRLCICCLANDAESDRRWTEFQEQQRPDEERFDRIADRINQSIAVAKTEEERAERLKRLSRAIDAEGERASKAPLTFDERTRHELLVMGFVTTVFSKLDIALIAAPEALRVLLSDEQRGTDALIALDRIGPVASEFVPDLMERLSSLPRSASGSWDDCLANAIGAVGRGNATVVRTLMTHLHSSNRTIRNTAVQALSRLGRDVAGLHAEILTQLKSKFREDPKEAILISALASVGRGDPESRRIVIEIVKSDNQRWAAVSADPTHCFVPEMVRALAIDGMQCFTDYPEECIPALIEAARTFDEPDSDMYDDGPFARIAHVLREFGPAAAPAVSLMVQQLEQDEEGQIPTAILRALAAIGPGAEPALELLKARRAEYAYQHSLGPLDEQTVGRHSDPYGWTICQIRRQISS